MATLPILPDVPDVATLSPWADSPDVGCPANHVLCKGDELNIGWSDFWAFPPGVGADNYNTLNLRAVGHKLEFRTPKPTF